MRGVVFAEAMSYGVPVLTSTQDASLEINLQGETGFSVDRGDRDVVINRIVAVLEKDRLFDRLSRNAHNHWSRNFCFSAFRERFLRAAASAGLPSLAAWPQAARFAKTPDIECS